MIYDFMINGRHFQVDGSGEQYLVYLDGIFAGHVAPVWDDTELRWVSSDPDLVEMAEQIGAEIERSDR